MSEYALCCPSKVSLPPLFEIEKSGKYKSLRWLSVIFPNASISVNERIIIDNEIFSRLLSFIIFIFAAPFITLWNCSLIIFTIHRREIWERDLEEKVHFRKVIQLILPTHVPYENTLRSVSKVCSILTAKRLWSFLKHLSGYTAKWLSST